MVLEMHLCIEVYMTKKAQYYWVYMTKKALYYWCIYVKLTQLYNNLHN